MGFNPRFGKRQRTCLLHPRDVFVFAAKVKDHSPLAFTELHLPGPASPVEACEDWELCALNQVPEKDQLGPQLLHKFIPPQRIINPGNKRSVRDVPGLYPLKVSTPPLLLFRGKLKNAIPLRQKRAKLRIQAKELHISESRKAATHAIVSVSRTFAASSGVYFNPRPQPSYPMP
jgi:hypothetical protein